MEQEPRLAPWQKKQIAKRLLPGEEVQGIGEVPHAAWSKVAAVLSAPLMVGVPVLLLLAEVAILCLLPFWGIEWLEGRTTTAIAFLLLIPVISYACLGSYMPLVRKMYVLQTNTRLLFLKPIGFRGYTEETRPLPEPESQPAKQDHP